LSLNIISGTGTIKVAPITSIWDTASTYNTEPIIDKTKSISIAVNAIGTVTTDITTLMRSMWGLTFYGLAVYTDDGISSFQIEVFGNSISYTYQSTYLLPPEVIYGNRVHLTWAPVIVERPISFISLILKRDTDPSFSNPVTVYTSYQALADNQCDDVLTDNQTYYYQITVTLSSLAYDGNIWNFQLVDENIYVQQDSINGTDFTSETVAMHKTRISGTYLEQDFISSTGFTFDGTNVVFSSSKVQLISPYNATQPFQVNLPPIDVSKVYNITGSTISDSSLISAQIQLTTAMVAQGAVSGGTGNVFTQLINKRAITIGVI
jgi:hypothetical protein